jgi:hypothetical protein
LYSTDLAALLTDQTFLAKFKNRFGFWYGDIPFGYFPDDPADKVWSDSLMTTVATASFACTTETATFVVRMGDRGGEKWREVLEQAGWYVRRDRVMLINSPPWMKRKAFISMSPSGVNATVFWIVAHKNKRAFFESRTPFGTLAHSPTPTHTQ